jgi:hypothetical protein
MRVVALVLVALLAVTAWPATAAPRKHHGKRAKVHRKLARASNERLVDLAQPRAPAPPPPLPPPGPALPSFVSVAAKEFSLTLSRPLVGKGSVRIELRNNGEDPHNLVVSPEGTHSPLESFSTLDSGTYERRSITLGAGRYQLWCSLEGHEAKGMKVTLRVE